jgi:GNAT superfamily N-acetyltransferase
METANVVHIRSARIKDAPALADVYAQAWRGAYRGIIPHLSLERMVARRGLGWWKSALAERRPLLVLDFGGEVAGYATYGRCRLGRTPFQGEIFELYLHPIYQGLGLGEQLFDCARKRLADIRLKGLVVWALTENGGACSFYLSLGGKPVAEGAERFGEISLRKVAFAWS